MRFLAICSTLFPPHGAAMTALCLALAMMLGCQPGESAKSKKPVSKAAAASDKPNKEDDKAPPAAKPTNGREVLARMVDAYKKAASYIDYGVVRRVVEADGKAVQDETAKFSLAFVRPNKLRFRAYDAELVCNGKTMFAYVKDTPGQVFNRPAPERMTMRNVLPDWAVMMAMNTGFAHGMPQIPLLLDKEPLKMLVGDEGQPELSEPGEIDGHACYRVKVNNPDGVATFWIDEETYVLRRIVMPTERLRELMSQEAPVSSISLVADFAGAQLNAKIKPEAFEFEVPKDAKLVEFLVPPHMGQLLNKQVPDFKFTEPAGKPVTPETLAGKTAVIAFWSIRNEPCRDMLKGLDAVVQKYKDNPKVAFYAVCADPSQFSNSDMEKAVAELNTHVPILRDLDRTGAVFNPGEPPTTFIINEKGIVQHCEGGLNPKYAEALQAKLDKVLAGEEIYQEPLKQFLEQVEQLRQFAESTKTEPPEPKQGDATVVKEVPIPAARTAERSAPSRLKLAPFWKCADLKMPGNILVLGGKNGPERLLVIDNSTSVAEVGLDGKVITVHKLSLNDKETVGSLRTAVGADGRRYFVAFIVSEQRCHLYDENWNLVAHFPEDALQHRHSGISDVRLGDLDGDGRLKMYVSYWDLVGVQSVSLEGKRLWGNRTALSGAACLAIGNPDAKGQRDLLCADNTGGLVLLDARGERRGQIRVSGRLLFRIADADLRGDGKPLWCGLAALKPGEAAAVGFILDGGKGMDGGEEVWSYPLPVGVPSQPIEPIISGKLTNDGAGQWILPGPDGSIHVISADGKPLDKFNYGAVLHGLATFQAAGQNVLVVASPNGLEAWKVE
jgi:outer membrane lipoprotein-sorting protein